MASVMETESGKIQENIAITYSIVKAVGAYQALRPEFTGRTLYFWERLIGNHPESLVPTPRTSIMDHCLQAARTEAFDALHDATV